MNYVQCNYCNSFNNTHVVEIFEIASVQCNSKIQLQAKLQKPLFSCSESYCIHFLPSKVNNISHSVKLMIFDRINT